MTLVCTEVVVLEHLRQVGRISPGRGTTIPFQKVCDTGAPKAERVIYIKCMYTG